MDSKRGVSWDAIIAVCAIVTALVSLVVGFQQTRIQQQTLSATVWPFVVLDSSGISPDGRPRLVLQMTNNGVGPAKIRTFTLTYGGRQYATSKELLHACCRGTEFIYSNFAGGVIPAHDHIDYLTADYTPVNRAHWGAIAGMAQGISVRMCYCSVLDECWVTSSPSDGPPQPVRDCPPVQEPQYQG